MNRNKLITIVAPALCAIFISFLFIACEPPPDNLAVTLDTSDITTTSIESVQGDVDIVYPIVPDDGKTGGYVTMPPSTTKNITTTVSQSGFTTELAFRRRDLQSFGEVVLTFRGVPGKAIKVDLTGPKHGAVESPAWHEVYTDNTGVAVTSWNVTVAGAYVASGTLMTVPTKDFTIKLIVN
jgi:hypothetical protein